MVVFAVALACDNAGDVVLTDADNFQYASDVTVPLSPAPAQDPDAGLDWCGLEVDLLGQPVSLDVVAEVQILNFPELSVDEFAEGVATDSLTQGMLGLFGEASADECITRVKDFLFEGAELDLHEETLQGSGTWVVALYDSEGGVLRFHAFEFRDDAVEQTVLIGTDAQIVPLVSLAPAVEVGSVERIDWSDLTVDGLGNPLEHHRLDVLTVARVDLEPREIEERFAELDGLLQDRQDLDVSGTVRAEVQVEPDGQGTWLAALWCSTCGTPVPRVLAVIE